MRKVICLVFIFFLAGGLALADTWQERLEEILQSSHIPPAGAEAITALFSTAEDKHIPFEALVPRLEEGTAKRVPPNRIEEVLERELNAYMKTREIVFDALGEETAQHFLQGTAPWSRTVILYLQGVEQQDLIYLLQAFSRQDRAVRWTNYRYGASLYAALNQWGLGKETSLEIVSAAADSSIPGDSYKGILEILISGSRLRVSPDTMAERITRALPDTADIEELQDRVLY